MTKTALKWPALSGVDIPKEHIFHFARGIWGKVHGAHSDYRWIAKSKNFGHHCDYLEQKISIGTEDQPKRSSYWCYRNQRYCAVFAYPSRAIDASGRRGFLEKQVLEWVPETPKTVTGVAAAFILLAEAAHNNDEIWWAQSEAQPWHDEDFSLLIATKDVQPIKCTRQRLVEQINSGITALTKTMTLDLLRDFYRQLLLSRQQIRPFVMMPELPEPLPPTALAALLLPLSVTEKKISPNSLSVAGWLPSSRYQIDELKQHWNVVFSPHAKTTDITVTDNATTDQAHHMAEALYENNPALLQSPILARNKRRLVQQQKIRIPPKLPLKKPPGDAPEFIVDLYHMARVGAFNFKERKWKITQVFPEHHKIAELILSWQKVSISDEFHQQHPDWLKRMRIIACLLIPSFQLKNPLNKEIFLILQKYLSEKAKKQTETLRLN